MEFIDLKTQYEYLKPQIDERIERVLKKGSYILGEEVQELEKMLADYVGVKNVITCSDGTAALQLIYMAYGIGPGDAVFCPDMTFIASIEPACLLGATPVFCEIDSKSYNLCPEGLERQIKNVIREGRLHPKAILAVDFVGNPANYRAIQDIAKRYEILLIEDAAQGMGASASGKKCGSFGDIAATSFFPSKPLGCYGDGGAVFTNSDEITTLLKSYRVHGQGKDKYDNVRIGINSRLDTIQAAILLEKLKALDEEIEKRQKIAKRYDDALIGHITVPNIEEGCLSSYAQYVLMAEGKEQRAYILQKLKNDGVPTILYYPTPMHLLPVFQGINCYGEKYINTIFYSECSFGVPFSPYLAEEDQDKVIAGIISACMKR